MNFGEVLRGFRRTLELSSFADAGRAPAMTDVEVAVCFADLRGFTSYVHNLQRNGQDNRVQHFLRSYFPIYPEAVLKEIWNMEPDEGLIAAKIDEIRRLSVPATYKNLGDGMMIVWEIQKASSMEVQGATTRVIFNIVQNIQRYFRELVTQLGPVEIDSYSRYVSDLKMGFGLARGHAWRLNFSPHLPPDYAGSIVNLAARLQGLARPEGIVAQLGFSESLFHDRVANKEGKIGSIPAPKGLGIEPLEVWMSNAVVLPFTSEKGS